MLINFTRYIIVNKTIEFFHADNFPQQLEEKCTYHKYAVEGARLHMTKAISLSIQTQTIIK